VELKDLNIKNILLLAARETKLDYIWGGFFVPVFLLGF